MAKALVMVRKKEGTPGQGGVGENKDHKRKEVARLMSAKGKPGRGRREIRLKFKAQKTEIIAI